MDGFNTFVNRTAIIRDVMAVRLGFTVPSWDEVNPPMVTHEYELADKRSLRTTTPQS